MSNQSDLHKKIINVFELLQEPSLNIPSYQRPYKWTDENINQLFSDIVTHSDKKAYRLGTIVFHQETDKDALNIVDGQQRTITLLLAAKALLENRVQDLKRSDLKGNFESLSSQLSATLERLEFPNEISRRNINNNYLNIVRTISRPEFTEEHISYLLHQCEIVTFVLDDISEAFQFFDSQNARGRDLSPHDLLKAYHLRQFAPEDEDLKAQTIARWEDTDSTELADLFAEKLYRIRNWSKGASARYFTKDDTGAFKGVNLSTSAPFPYTDQLRISHHFVDRHRSQYERRIDQQHLSYPFQVDQIIINGRRFFELADHYLGKISCLTDQPEVLRNSQTPGTMAEKILTAVNKYDGQHRTGDRYVRSIFDCLLIYYLDKFGEAELSQAIEKIFVWSFSIRLKMHSVQLATIDNYVLQEGNLFVHLKEAIQPKDFNHRSLTILNPSNIRCSRAAEIKALFTEMKYLTA